MNGVLCGAVQSPYGSGPTLLNSSASCALPESVAVPFDFDAAENGTICGVCSAASPVPLPLDSNFFPAANAVVGWYAMNSSKPVCSDHAPPASVNVTDVVGYCGTQSNQMEGGYSNLTLDVRFAADFFCGAKSFNVVLRGIFSSESTMQGSMPAVVSDVEEISV